MKNPKAFTWPVSAIADAIPSITPTERRALPVARPATTPNPPRPAPQGPAAILPMRYPVVVCEKPPRPAYNPRFIVHTTEQMVERTAAAWQAEQFAAKTEKWLAELTLNGERLTQKHAHKVEDRVRTTFSYMSEENQARVREVLTNNPWLRDFDVLMRISRPRK